MAKKEFKSIVGDILQNEESQQAIDNHQETNTEELKISTTEIKDTKTLDYYKFNTTKEFMDLIRMVAMLKNKTIKEIFEEALNNYIYDPDKKELIDSAKTILNSMER